MGQRITMGEKVGYSLGDVAANLVFQMMMIYQLKFYTDIFGLDGAVAGTVLLIAPIASAFVDPFIGIITDRTNTRWGKYRPWLIWTAIPFCVFYVLAFWNPGIHDKTLVAVYATVSYLLLLTMYGFNNTPFASLGGVMTNDIQERTSINKVRFICTSVAQFVVQGFTLPLVDRFSNGDAAHGWVCTISLFAILALIFLFISFLSTRERIQPPPQQTMSVRDDVREAVLNAAKVYESLGAEIVCFDLPVLKFALPVYYIIACAEASSNLGRYDGIRYGYKTAHYTGTHDMICRTRSEGFGEEVKRRILLGTYVLSAGYYDAYYKKATDLRGTIIKAFNDAFEHCDVILAPTVPMTAFEKGHATSDPIETYLTDICTVPVNIAGLPGVSIPCGFNSKGMPIGMQLIGKSFGEAQIFNAAYKYQQAAPEKFIDTKWGVKL